VCTRPAAADRISVRGRRRDGNGYEKDVLFGRSSFLYIRSYAGTKFGSVARRLVIYTRVRCSSSSSSSSSPPPPVQGFVNETVSYRCQTIRFIFKTVSIFFPAARYRIPSTPEPALIFRIFIITRSAAAAAAAATTYALVARALEFRCRRYIIRTVIVDNHCCYKSWKARGPKIRTYRDLPISKPYLMVATSRSKFLSACARTKPVKSRNRLQIPLQ